jgi:hypothetical protein
MSLLYHAEMFVLPYPGISLSFILDPQRCNLQLAKPGHPAVPDRNGLGVVLRRRGNFFERFRKAE